MPAVDRGRRQGAPFGTPSSPTTSGTAEGGNCRAVASSALASCRCSSDTASALRARSASIRATLASRRVSSPALRRLATACAVLSNSSTERCSSRTRRCAASTAWNRRDASARAWRRASSISARKASSDAEAASRRRACWPPISIGCAMPRPHSRALPSGVAALRRVRSTLSSGLLKSSDAASRRLPSAAASWPRVHVRRDWRFRPAAAPRQASAGPSPRSAHSRERSRQPARRPAPGVGIASNHPSGLTTEAIRRRCGGVVSQSASETITTSPPDRAAAVEWARSGRRGLAGMWES
jgi:hypothetical protein